MHVRTFYNECREGYQVEKVKADDAVDILKDRCSVAVVVMSETAVKIIKMG